MATGGVASFEALRFAPSSVPSYSKCLPSPKRMINRCSDFIYRAPVSLIKKPCYDRIYGLSRTMRCFMIQGGFMLMIRSGLPSGPLSGHLSAPSAPAALDTPIFLAPRPFQRSSVLYPVRRRPDALPPSRISTHTDCSYNQYKRHSKATVPPRTASRFSLASS